MTISMVPAARRHATPRWRILPQALYHLLAGAAVRLWWRARGRPLIYNLNDPRWGRHDGEDRDGDRRGEPPRQQRPGDGPPDLDELWRDFNRRLSGLLGGRGGRGGGPRGPRGEGFHPDPKTAGVGGALIAGIVVLIWLGSGVFIVQEGQQGVVLQFGRYVYTTEAGFRWRLPYPIQSHEIVNLTQLRSVEIGSRPTVNQATGLRESSMLTQDENIIDIRFAVQYRLKDARDYLFETRDPDDAVVKAAETAVREIVGRESLDTVLYEARERVAIDLTNRIQELADRYRTGIQISSVAVQNVQPPDQVQAAFEDVIKAGQDRDRLRNEAVAYANDVIPRARGTASRLLEEASGYRERVIAQAQGDAERFRQVLEQYQKAPVVTRERLYLETMQQVYSNVSKVMIDSSGSGSNNLLYLPLDRLLQQSGGPGAATAPGGSSSGELTPSPGAAPMGTLDGRNRELLRNRERESR